MPFLPIFSFFFYTFFYLKCLSYFGLIFGVITGLNFEEMQKVSWEKNRLRLFRRRDRKVITVEKDGGYDKSNGAYRESNER